MKGPSYTTAVVGDPEIIEGILEDPEPPCSGGCGGLHGVEDLLSGSAGKGASVGAAVGSVIPGVGTVIGGAVGAVAGAVSDLFSGGHMHCTKDGHDVPCPPCAITDIECLKKWAISQRAPSTSVQQAALDAVRRSRIPATPHPQPKPVQTRRVVPMKPMRVARPVRPTQPMSVETHVNSEPSSAMPIVLGAAALLAAGGGAWWLWRKHTSEEAKR